MNDKTILLTIIGIIVFIFIFFGAIGIINAIKTNTKQTTFYDEVISKQIEDVESGKITGKYSSTELNEEYLNFTQEDRNNIDKTIDYIVDLINSHDIEKINSKLTLKYAYNRFREEEFLKEYLDETFGQNNKIVAKDFIVWYGRLTVPLYNSETGEYVESVTCTDYSDTEKLNLYFGKYDYEEKIAFNVRSDPKLVINCVTSYKYYDARSIVFYVYNYKNTKETVDFSGTEVYLNKEKTKKIKIKEGTNTKVEVEPNSYKLFELKFDPSDSDLAIAEMKVTIAGKTYENSRIISYDTDILG